MLKLHGADFTVGRSRFLDHSPDGSEVTAKVYLKIVPGGLDFPVVAQLDTGSAWSVLDCELADALDLLDGSGEPTQLTTRQGSQNGHLVRVPLIIPADDGQGASLEMEATFFVCPDWPRGKNFLGYSGLLEFIRIDARPRLSP